MTVIDGATGTPTTVNVGPCPLGVAVNPVTNRVYVADECGAGYVTIIDGSTDTVIGPDLVSGASPNALAVNLVTNKIYVTNSGGSTMTVIDGLDQRHDQRARRAKSVCRRGEPADGQDLRAQRQWHNGRQRGDNHTATVTVGTSPVAVAVNSITNKIYILHFTNPGAVTVIDGATNITSTVVVGANPVALAVNAITNKIYVANYGNATVIDGTDNSTVTIAPGIYYRDVAVNPVNNKIYVSANHGNFVVAIDGVSDSTTTILVGSYPEHLAVNPVTGQVFINNYGDTTVTAIADHPASAVPLETTISSLPDNTSVGNTPTFALAASSAYAPIVPPVQNVYFQVDTWTGRWQPATRRVIFHTVWWEATIPPQTYGVHTLYAYAADGQDAGSVNPSPNYSPVPGRIAPYVFLVVPHRIYMPLVSRW